MSGGGIVSGLVPPYWAVVFTSQRSDGDAGYAATAERMVALAQAQPGFLGVESVRDAQGLGITVSYWASEADIAHWRQHVEHTEARRQGRTQWYRQFELRVCRVERGHGFGQPG